MAFINLVFALIIFSVGAAVGSFLNVVIYRLPAGLSLLHPPSRCPTCLHPLRPYDNVPVLGWLWLRGRCRYCKTSISWRYPAIEALTGALFLAAFWRFDLSWQMAAAWLLMSWLLALAWIDLDTLTLPNALTQSGLLLGIGVQGFLGATAPDGSLSTAATHIIGAIAGAVLGIGLFDLISLLGATATGQTVMGGGDGKLAAMLGAWLGWQGMLLSGFLACALGAFVGGGAIALHLLNRRTPIPFGPFLALGGILVLFWGDRLIAAYLALFFPVL